MYLEILCLTDFGPLGGLCPCTANRDQISAVTSMQLAEMQRKKVLMCRNYTNAAVFSRCEFWVGWTSELRLSLPHPLEVLNSFYNAFVVDWFSCWNWIALRQVACTNLLSLDLGMVCPETCWSLDALTLLDCSVPLRIRYTPYEMEILLLGMSCSVNYVHSPLSVLVCLYLAWHRAIRNQPVAARFCSE